MCRQLCTHRIGTLPARAEEDFQIEYETCFFVVNEYLWTQRRPHQLRWHNLCYRFDPDTLSKEDTSIAISKKREYYTMLDLNRLMYMVSPIYSSKMFVKESVFQETLIKLMRIEPETDRTEAEKEQRKEYLDSIRR